MAQMTGGSKGPASLVEWGVAESLFPGEAVSGDRAVVTQFEKGVLLAVVDGLGHGNEAAEAAQVATATLGAHPDEPVVSLFRRCHAALARTRGAAMTIVSLDAHSSSLTWAAVGNVVGVLVRAKPVANSWREVVSMRGGVVGYALPSLCHTVVSIGPGDVLALASDGIRDGFDAELRSTESVKFLASLILERYGRRSDDAIVLVARWLAVPR